jgi:hypothetical protein
MRPPELLPKFCLGGRTHGRTNGAPRVSQRELALVSEGLEAWRQGDLGRVKAFLHPAATWRGFEPRRGSNTAGEWDCANREYEQGFGRVRMELVDAGPGKVIAVSS